MSVSFNRAFAIKVATSPPSSPAPKAAAPTVNAKPTAAATVPTARPRDLATVQTVTEIAAGAGGAVLGGMMGYSGAYVGALLLEQVVGELAFNPYVLGVGIVALGGLGAYAVGKLAYGAVRGAIRRHPVSKEAPVSISPISPVALPTAKFTTAPAKPFPSRPAGDKVSLSPVARAAGADETLVIDGKKNEPRKHGPWISIYI